MAFVMRDLLELQLTQEMTWIDNLLSNFCEWQSKSKEKLKKSSQMRR